MWFLPLWMVIGDSGRGTGKSDTGAVEGALLDVSLCASNGLGKMRSLTLDSGLDLTFATDYAEDVEVRSSLLHLYPTP